MVFDESPLAFQEPYSGGPMAEITPADFFVRLPEFEGRYTLAQIQAQIIAVKSQVSRAAWGQYYHDGISNLIAHRLTWAEYMKRHGISGVMLDDKASKAVGSVSVSRYGPLLMAKVKDPLLATVYGAEYRRLQRIVTAGMRAV